MSTVNSSNMSYNIKIWQTRMRSVTLSDTPTYRQIHASPHTRAVFQYLTKYLTLPTSCLVTQSEPVNHITWLAPSQSQQGLEYRHTRQVSCTPHRNAGSSCWAVSTPVCREKCDVTCHVTQFNTHRFLASWYLSEHTRLHTHTLTRHVTQLLSGWDAVKLVLLLTRF